MTFSTSDDPFSLDSSSDTNSSLSFRISSGIASGSGGGSIFRLGVSATKRSSS